MKNVLFFSSIWMAAILIGCATGNSRRMTNPGPENPLIGAWTLVSSNNTNPEGEYVIFDKSNTRQIKILTPDHFMFITERIENGEKKFASAAGGRYELDGRTYIEYIDYASWEDVRDAKAEFTWRIDNDRWYHTGLIYVSHGENILIEEVWERVSDDDLDASR
ncbi:hypothetical protein BH23BAC1_BH23BAC1_38940 [soil metagenome]